jgi:hypothetical protein
MPAQSPSTTLYSLGKGVMKVGDWSGATPPTFPSGYTDVGNCPDFTVEVTEEVLDHYSSRSGIKTKDKSVTLETGYTVKFKLDEKSVKNLQMFLKATLSGSNILLANTQLDKEYALYFVSDNPVGPNESWSFWRCKLKPDGAFSLIGTEWQTLGFSGEGLSDVANHVSSPFFTVTFATTTTTTTTSSSTTTTTS